MPLSLDTLSIQANQGSFNAASGSVSLGSGTTAGNTVLIIAAIPAPAGNFNVPTGFVADRQATAGQTRPAVFRRGPTEGLAAGETSWTLSTTGGSGPIPWICLEVPGLDSDLPLDASSSTTTTTSGTSASTGTSGTNIGYDVVWLAVHSAYRSASATPTTFSGQTNGFTELYEQGAAGASTSVGLALSAMTSQQLAAQSCTATTSTTLTATDTGVGFVLGYRAAGSEVAVQVSKHYGFEQRTSTGLTLGAATGLGYLETATAGVTVENDAVKAHTGSGYLKITASSAIANATTTSIAVATTSPPRGAVYRIPLYFDGGLPGGDLELFTIITSTGVNAVFTYRTSSSKIGCKVGTGTEVLSDTTVTANVWLAVELRGQVRLIGVNTSYLFDWSVDYGNGTLVAQSQAASQSPVTAATTVQLRLGWSAAQSGTVLFDDVIEATRLGQYPMGDMRVYPLKADPAGTITISGTSSNFGVMTANGTIGAWNAANALAAIDDIPPTLGASADGLVAVTGHATDYAEIPLETYNASGVGSIRAVKAVLPLWAASGTAATCRIDGWDGTNSTALFAEADPNADNTTSSTWVCVMWAPSGGWTQAKLDAATIRFGAADATPDIGLHAVLCEAAIQPGNIMTLFGDLATANRDPVSGGIMAVGVTNPAGKASTLHYEESGSPTDVPVSTGASHTETIDAPDAPAVNYVALYPDPEPAPLPE